MTTSWERLVRFTPKSSTSSILIGEPVDKSLDVGVATHDGKDVEVNVYSGKSVLSPGEATGKKELVARLLSPLSKEEVGSIRCIGLNYHQHAKEAKMAAPTVPVLFMKPATALADPYPAPTPVPRFSAQDDCCDYESELCVVIGKPCKDVSEADALDYVLGYTASNDISHRDTQFEQSQWGFSKGFDGSCPIGPALVSSSSIPNPAKLHIRGLKNGKVMQDCAINDLIFSVAKCISFLSRSTTLEAGTIILTGTPAGVGFGYEPKEYLREGDEFAVEVSGGVGTLFSVVRDEKKY